MNLISLKYFYDSARLGSMTKAADLNHISRPAISQAIMKLEEEIGSKLLNHKRRGFELTDGGRVLLENAERIFTQVESVKSQLLAKGPISGKLRIGSARTLATFGLQRSLSEFRKKYKEVSFNVRIENSQRLIQLLINREIDLAVLIGDDVEPGYKQEMLGRGHFCLVKPKNISDHSALYALTEKRPETDRVRVIYERKFAKPLQVFAEISSWDAIWTWIRSGICGGLIPDFLLESENTNIKNISVVIDKVLPYEIKVMYPESRSFDPIIRAMLSCLRN